MDLQTVFYVLGIVFMTLAIGILVGLFIIVFYLLKKVSNLSSLIEKTVEDIKDRPGEIASEIGAVMVKSAVKKAKSMFEGDR